jgi:hypothetical protein
MEYVVVVLGESGAGTSNTNTNPSTWFHIKFQCDVTSNEARHQSSSSSFSNAFVWKEKNACIRIIVSVSVKSSSTAVRVVGERRGSRRSHYPRLGDGIFLVYINSCSRKCTCRVKSEEKLHVRESYSNCTHALDT